MSRRSATLDARGVLVLALASLAGCDVDQSVFFQLPIEGVPAVADLGEIVPFDVPTDLVDLDPPTWPGVDTQGQTPLNNRWRDHTLQRVLSEIRPNVMFAELGPTGSYEIGGATMEFVGTGNSVCIWVDPEVVSWSQNVSPTDFDEDLQYPDNLFDDGDIDIDAGPTVFYTGTPGEKMGLFRANYEDSLGVETVIELSDCERPPSQFAEAVPFAGRAIPESCSIPDTIPGRRYTIVLEAFSLPLDDKRLGFGVMVTNGGCDELDAALGGMTTSAYRRECVITGEAIKPGQAQGENAIAAGLGGLSWKGSEVEAWEGATDFERSFCHLRESGYEARERLGAFCEREYADVLLDGDQCSWQYEPTGLSGDARRCYCGDDTNSPRAGAL
jgi:hypothetical protein